MEAAGFHYKRRLKVLVVNDGMSIRNQETQILLDFFDGRQWNRGIDPRIGGHLIHSWQNEPIPVVDDHDVEENIDDALW